MSFTKLTEYIDNLGRDFNIPARDFMITVDGKEVYRRFSGCRDEAGGVPMNGAEAYWIYSMTKPQTCACALKLAEDGVISLDDPVGKYIPAFERYPAMTVEHLMSMRGGLDYDLRTPALEARDAGEGTLDIVARIAERQLHFEPGTDFLYSLCHDVLAGVIEVASGMKFGEYMSKFIWEPLGMTNTAFAPNDYHRENICAQYQRGADGDSNVKIPDMENVYRLTESYESGGAGIITTMEDYMRFSSAVVCGRLLSMESINTWRGRTLEGKARETFAAMGRVGYNYALGVQVIVDNSRVGCPLGVYGWDGAAGAATMLDPDRRVAMVYMQHVKGCGVVYSTVHPALRDMAYAALREEGYFA